MLQAVVYGVLFFHGYGQFLNRHVDKTAGDPSLEPGGCSLGDTNAQYGAGGLGVYWNDPYALAGTEAPLLFDRSCE